jgi:hypothetical protein
MANHAGPLQGVPAPAPGPSLAESVVVGKPIAPVARQLGVTRAVGEARGNTRAARGVTAQYKIGSAGLRHGAEMEWNKILQHVLYQALPSPRPYPSDPRGSRGRG